MANTRTRKKDWGPDWLKAFEQTGMVSEACRAAKVGRTTVYERRQRDEPFAVAWADVEERTTEQLEREAIRRAKDGSDTLLIFMLKARRPEVYAFAERMRHEHEHVVKTELVTDEKFAEDARDLLRRAAASSAS